MRLQKNVRSTLLCGCLCLLALQQCGIRCASVIDQLLTARHPASSSFAAGNIPSSAAALANACDGLSSDAVLTDRRQLSLVSAGLGRTRAAFVPMARFHNDSRPRIIRTRAVFCDFSLLRSILHPQLGFLEHAAAVLC
jgi:hypothetical protein